MNGKMKYKLISYDFTREWEKNAKTQTGLTKHKLLQAVEDVLDNSQAPMIKIEPWRE